MRTIDMHGPVRNTMEILVLTNRRLRHGYPDMDLPDDVIIYHEDYGDAEAEDLTGALMDTFLVDGADRSIFEISEGLRLLGVLANHIGGDEGRRIKDRLEAFEKNNPPLPDIPAKKIVDDTGKLIV